MNLLQVMIKTSLLIFEFLIYIYILINLRRLIYKWIKYYKILHLVKFKMFLNITNSINYLNNEILFNKFERRLNLSTIY